MVPSVVGGLAAYGYAQTDSIFLLLTAAWFAGFAIFNVLAWAFGKYNTPTIMSRQIPVVGLVVGGSSIVAHFVFHSHWFMLAHGLFWIFFSLFALVVPRLGQLLVEQGERLKLDRTAKPARLP